ncbi:Uncharacterised protein [Salmonella enterica subsp. indica]|uniref:Uncharacterized protein n=1 Tax=Salmonella enterica subsp. indica TaxID=59207 RepID=A0A379XX01_SALER|nr:Uncharacterised protein [Salmonella enterica subsp. indica]
MLAQTEAFTRQTFNPVGVHARVEHFSWRR